MDRNWKVGWDISNYQKAGLESRKGGGEIPRHYMYVKKCPACRSFDDNEKQDKYVCITILPTRHKI